MLEDETNLVVERLNNFEITRATLLREAVMGILSKPARKSFDEKIRDLNIRTVARERETPEG